FANAVGIADGGALAHRVEQYYGQLTAVGFGAHHQTTACLIGEARFGEAHTPVRVLHQRVGVVEHQAIGGGAEAHIPVCILSELADQRLAIGGGDELGQIL